MSVDKTNRPSMASLFAGLASVFKSIPDDKVEDLKDVLDTWNEPGGEHKNPSRADIVTGPAERASGDGAPKMIAEYSQPAPQQGLTGQYQEFQRMLDGWGKSFVQHLNSTMAPRMDRHEKAISGLVAFVSGLQKAHADAEAAVKSAAAGPSEDTFLGKSLLKLTKAHAALRKADLADEDEKEERKSHLAQAADLLKSAKRLLAKATEEMEETGDEEGCEKAMAKLRSLTKAVAKAEEEDKEREDAAEKARQTTVKAEEDKKREEEEAAKAKADAAAKALTDDAAAKAAPVSQEQILKALEGLTVLPTTVQGLVDAVMGKSQNPGGAPAITKGTVTQVDFAKVVDEAIDDGRLSDANITKAMSIVQHMHLAKEGRVDQRIVDQEIEKSPAEVRDLFRVAA
jgi:hypothetical protein